MKNALKKAKYVLRRNARKGRLRRTWATLHYLENLWKFHAPIRFKNQLVYKYLICSKKMTSLIPGKGINNGVFFLGLKHSASGPSLVVKIPRFDSPYGEALRRKVMNLAGWREYEETLINLHKNPITGEHFPVVHSVSRDGGYESEFIPGINLRSIREDLRRNRPLPQEVEPIKLKSAIEELLSDLKKSATEKGRLTGDWAPHNLIYSLGKNRIFNVDLEGMVIYDPTHIEANIEYIEAELRSFLTALELRSAGTEESRMILSTLAECVRVSDSGYSYSGNAYFAGYHTLNLRGRVFNGQRRPAWRLLKIPFDFTGKTVLDIGCNTGGMLHALADTIGFGIGIDRDECAINAAKSVARVNGKTNLDFHMFDIEHGKLEDMIRLLSVRKVDLCMMLSICMWINNCRDVMRFTTEISNCVLIETNGSPLQQEQQGKWLREVFQNVDKLAPESLDDYQQKNRALFLCKSAYTGKIEQ